MRQLIPQTKTGRWPRTLPIGDPHLKGRWRQLARIVWTVLILVALAVFAVSIPQYMGQFHRVCAGDECITGQLTADSVRTLSQLGFSISDYAVFKLILALIIALIWFITALVIVWRTSCDRLALLVALFLVAQGAYTTTYILESQPIVWQYPAKLVHYLANTLLFLVFCLFPNGQFRPAWTRWLAIGSSLLVATDFFRGWPGTGSGFLRLFGTGQILLYVAFYLGLIAGQVIRYRRFSNLAQQQQTKWVVASITIVLVVEIGVVLFQVLGSGSQSGGIAPLFSENMVFLISVLIPIAFGIAILRYRLWDIDLIIHRTLVYGTLTVCVVGFYILLVGGLGALIPTSGSVLVSLLATAVVAVLFAPLRDRLQRGVNRLLYGQRDEPYAVLSRLGQQLEATLAPSAVLPTIVTTLKEALKLPYVAIALDQEGRSIEVAAAGTLTPHPLCLPLLYQGETIGQLILAPRAPGEAFIPAERRLLDDLAHQAGVAAAAVRLTADLQRSRERLVTAREEERRRLRRDLHDGLGPALASHTLKIGSARILLQRDPAATDTLLAELETDIQTALTDIRRLVYNLRPPALDELGLIGAIRESATQYGWLGDGLINGSNTHRLHIVLTAPERLPPLPAAAEVAAYRIVQEALTNVVRHAQARTCTIRLAIGEPPAGDELPEEAVPGLRSPVSRLELEISDDGVGLPSEHHAGVGLTSMRERAQELGGTCQIETVPTGGVRIVARLPLPRKRERREIEETDRGKE